MRPAEHAVDVRRLRKTYGTTTAVEDVSFHLEEGEIFGLLGPNGSGKTTSVECLQGLRRPDQGTLTVFGHDVQHEPSVIRRLVGSQLQDAALPDRIRVWEALQLFASASERGRPWEQLLEEWGLSEHRDQAFGDLSGGQQQRLFIALALVTEPRLVVLDEMTTGLDPAARRVAWDLVAQVRDRGATVLLVTHFMDEADRLCDRLALLRHGQVVATGTPNELVAFTQRRTRVRFSLPAGTDPEFLRRINGVEELSVDGGTTVVSGDGPLLARVAHALVERDIEPLDLEVERPSLEEAYLALTSDGEPAGEPGNVGT